MHDPLLIVEVIDADHCHFNLGEYLIARDTGNKEFYIIESDTSGNMERQGSYFKFRFRVVIDFRDLCFRYNVMAGGAAKTIEQAMK